MSNGPPLLLLLLLLSTWWVVVPAQDYDDDAPTDPSHACNGIFLTYVFESREKEYPRVKNASAQAYAFRSTATVLNAGKHELKAWKIFVGFQHEEILVSVNGAVVTDGEETPFRVGKKGAHLTGFPMTDLKNSMDTAGDLNQIKATIDFVGTQFGVKSPKVPMPKTIELVNDGYKCPKPTSHENSMHVCCVKDPKFKKKKNPTSSRFLARRSGDLTMSYDVLQAYEGNYLAQVTMNNNNPLGRLDNWNLTWTWMRGEFINKMRGGYTFSRSPSACLYSATGNFYRDFDFTHVMSCEKRPVITDLPPQMANDTRVGKLPFCCKNGTLLPPNMDSSKSTAIFQLQVFKIPPDMNRTALYPPQNWKISGYLNPKYKCGAPIRVSPTEFPDPSGLMARSYAVASWQVVCNITRPKAKQTRCCVSYSAFYNDSVVPCNTCACGCPLLPHHHHHTCNTKAHALLLPPEALLIPFSNRTAKAKAWARIKRFHVPTQLPCGDNCGVSINWHVHSDYRTGWTARITIFNWDQYTFKDWFAAVQLKKKVVEGYEKTYSFNGTVLPNEKNDTLFFQGLPGLNYLMPEVDGKNPETDPRVPGKQQSVISFKKKLPPGFDVVNGDGFPDRVLFNGEECALPHFKPKVSGVTTTTTVRLRGVQLIVLAMWLSLVFGFLF